MDQIEQEHAKMYATPYNPRGFIAEVSDETRKSFIRDWEEMERTGSIGDCPLRVAASLLTSVVLIGLPITTVMRDLAHESYRFYYYDGRE